MIGSFVAQCFYDNGIFELDPSGDSEPRLILDGLGEFCGLNGMDWGPDGRLYGPRWFNNEIVSLDVDTGELRKEASGLNVPAAVKFNSEGVLHVLDTGAGKVYKVIDNINIEVATISNGLDNLAINAMMRSLFPVILRAQSESRGEFYRRNSTRWNIPCWRFVCL